MQEFLQQQWLHRGQESASCIIAAPFLTGMVPREWGMGKVLYCGKGIYVLQWHQWKVHALLSLLQHVSLSPCHKLCEMMQLFWPQCMRNLPGSIFWWYQKLWQFHHCDHTSNQEPGRSFLNSWTDILEMLIASPRLAKSCWAGTLGISRIWQKVKPWLSFSLSILWPSIYKAVMLSHHTFSSSFNPTPSRFLTGCLISWKCDKQEGQVVVIMSSYRSLKQCFEYLYGMKFCDRLENTGWESNEQN